MYKTLKIIHLSDLHCDSTPQWEEAFSPAQNFLSTHVDEDSLVIITGDLVDTPNAKNFETLLVKLTAILEVKSPLGIICVPGNHDVLTLGNRFLNFPKFDRIWKMCCQYLPIECRNRNVSYKDFAAKLDAKINGGDGSQSPHLFPGIRRKLLNNYGLAVYLFDSNHANGRKFAEGSISMDNVLENDDFLSEQSNGFLNQYKKIALLHHHPLSIHSGKPSFIRAAHEATLELTNKKAFTDLLSERGIDVVLHGHQHKSTKYSFDPQRRVGGQPFFVSGCGSSSAADKGGKNEIRTYSFSSFAASGASYTAEPGQMFDRDGQEFQLINAERSRRRIAENGYVGTDEYSCNDLRATSKMKELLLFANGQVTSEIVFTGISSVKQERETRTSLTELIAADTGRIFSAAAVFDSKRVAYHYPQNSWVPLTPNRPNGNGPCANEFVELEVINDRREVSCPDTLRMQYHQRGGFALNSWSHDEFYSHSSSAGKKSEYCAIYSQIPVDHLEMCITFPEGFFPPPNSLDIKVYKRDATKMAKDGTQEISHLLHHSDEESFLNGNNCLRIWQLARTVSLRVPNPQPNLIYTVHWDVPEARQLPESRQLESIRKCFAGDSLSRAGRKKRNSLLAEINSRLKQLFEDEVNIYCFVPAHRAERKVLELIYSSENGVVDGKERPAMFRGRGIAGAAYMQKSNVYYNKDFKVVDNLNVEEVVPGLKPSAVIGLPITYPLFFKNAKLVNSSAQQPVLVISIVAEEENSIICKEGKDGVDANSVPTPNGEKIKLWFNNSTAVIADILQKNDDCFSISPPKGSAARRKSTARSSRRSFGSTTV